MKEQIKEPAKAFSWKGNLFRPSADLSWRDVNGELVVLNVKTGAYSIFNDTARLVWLSITEGKTSDQTIDCIVESYAVDRKPLVNDVKMFIDGLLTGGLLQQLPNPKGRSKS